MDPSDVICLQILQSLFGDLDNTNEDSLEARWYAYWSVAFSRERRLNPKRVSPAPQYPLTKHQLTNDGDLRASMLIPDFVPLYVHGHRGVPRQPVVTSEHQVRDYAHMLSYYMGDCVVDDCMILAVCEIKALPKVSPNTPRERFFETFDKKMRGRKSQAIFGTRRQLGLFFSSLADEGKHVDGVAAIAAVGPFFSVANCTKDEAEFLSNNTDPTWREWAENGQRSNQVLPSQSDDNYLLQQPKMTLRPIDKLKQTARYAHTVGMSREDRTTIASSDRHGNPEPQTRGRPQGDTTTDASNSRGDDAIALIRRQMTIRESSGPALATPRVGTNTRTQVPVRLQHPGEPTTAGGSGAPGADTNTAASGSSGAQVNVLKQTAAGAIRSTAQPAVVQAPEAVEGPHSDQAIARASETTGGPRSARQTRPGHRPSRIPRLSGGFPGLDNHGRDTSGVAGVTHDQELGGTGQPAAPSTTATSQNDGIQVATLEWIAQHLEETRVVSPERRPTVKELKWTDFQCWTDDRAESLKDKLLRFIKRNNPERPLVVNPDWNRG